MPVAIFFCLGNIRRYWQLLSLMKYVFVIDALPPKLSGSSISAINHPSHLLTHYPPPTKLDMTIAFTIIVVVAVFLAFVWEIVFRKILCISSTFSITYYHFLLWCCSFKFSLTFQSSFLLFFFPLQVFLSFFLFFFLSFFLSL